MVAFTPVEAKTGLFQKKSKEMFSHRSRLRTVLHSARGCFRVSQFSGDPRGRVQELSDGPRRRVLGRPQGRPFSAAIALVGLRGRRKRRRVCESEDRKHVFWNLADSGVYLA